MVDTASIVAARLRYAPTTKSNHYERTTSPPTAHPTDAHERHERTPRMHRMSKRRMHTTDESDSQGEKVGSRAGSRSSLFEIHSHVPRMGVEQGAFRSVPRAETAKMHAGRRKSGRSSHAVVFSSATTSKVFPLATIDTLRSSCLAHSTRLCKPDRTPQTESDSGQSGPLPLATITDHAEHKMSIVTPERDDRMAPSPSLRGDI
ncbi:hypothetical protein PAXINDRAFT_18568 [Paxillus involutus ATCC 200175]|uniref:Uncharacterized protein n=1 Tax=Paxillus involutus ATCC 200175 TaxID=664439 RepID=A0A0C9TKC7_PAXIN|nr:hypothetical protein PAXINDRAFT_18568 [Paxillus involutus ATCC 200175]